MSVQAIILAAGGGSRFASNTHKLLSTINGRSIVSLAIQSAVDAGIGEVLVVTGAANLDSVLREFPDVVQVHNHNWEAGQAVSIQCAIRSVSSEVTRVVVGLGDQPGIEPAAWRAIAEDPSEITVATYQGIRANPVGLNRSMWDLLPLDGDEGARKVMKMHPELVHELPCIGSSEDIDTVEDLRRWN
ncbi:MAG: nucleotidyltransferase family protein [Actinobacteria bacterium]|nr:nucleotidyltransferase family protein [Actinomycetota bacterium]